MVSLSLTNTRSVLYRTKVLLLQPGLVIHDHPGAGAAGADPVHGVGVGQAHGGRGQQGRQVRGDVDVGEGHIAVWEQLG